MKVYGFEPTEEQINAAIEYMKCSNKFFICHVVWALLVAGVPEYTYNRVADRMADRLIQKLKKEGKVHIYSHNLWEWIGE